MNDGFECQVLLMKLRAVIMQSVYVFSRDLISSGCRCKWEPAMELDEEQTVLEMRKTPIEAYYHLLLLIPPEIKEQTGYSPRSIGVHIDHQHDCPVRAKHFARFN